VVGGLTPESGRPHRALCSTASPAAGWNIGTKGPSCCTTPAACPPTSAPPGISCWFERGTVTAGPPD
jgi:hypothetical protein